MTRTVLITGCSSGFGTLTARTFRKAGWNVVATLRAPERTPELAAGEAPIHNPTGADAEMLIAMMGQDQRQAFLDRIAAMLVPPPAADPP